MASRFLVFFAVQGVVFQTVFGQCVNRVVPGCGPNVVETLLPNQVLIREPGLLPAGMLPLAPAGPLCPGQIVPGVAEAYAPTVIQDSSVANSLANALQLLVVSSLLSNTLPGPCGCDYPAYPIDYVGMPAYNYIY